MARTSNFANVATVTRASTKTDAGGWDFTSGGTVGTLTEYASGVAAIHSTAGLLVEESTTNEIRNPRCEGAVVGVPGTLPTNWSTNYPSGQEVVGSGTEDGTPYCDVRYNGTPSGNFTIQFDVSNFIVAASGEDWALSLGLKLVGGDFSNINNVKLRIGWSTSVPGFIQNNDGVNISGDINSSHRRFWHTFTAPATTGYANNALFFDYSGSGAVDFTLRIYAPQYEQKSYPTSPVFPVVSSPAASTRADDDVSIPNGAWSNDNGAGTFYIDASLNNEGASGNFGWLGGYGADNSNAIRVRVSTTTGFAAVAVDGGVTQFTSSNVSLTGAGQNVRAAVAWDTNEFAASFNGETQSTDASGTIGFGAAELTIANTGSAGPTSHYLKDFRYWPKRLTNAELEALVGN